jgi:autotransporter-associated beta strand protein
MAGLRASFRVVTLVSLLAGLSAADTVTNAFSGTQTVASNLVDSGGNVLAVQVASGVVTFTGTNSYSGGTEVLGGSTNVASSAVATTTTPLGGGPVTVRANGALTVDNARLGGLILTNSLYLNDGAWLQNSGDVVGGNQVAFSNDTVSLGGAVKVFVTGSANGGGPRTYLGLFGTVQNDGASVGSLMVTGSAYTGYLADGALRLGASNTFSGGITVRNNGRLEAWHNNAFGTGSLTFDANSILRLIAKTVTNDIAFANTSAVYVRNGNGGLDGTLTLSGQPVFCGGDDNVRTLYLNQNGGRMTGAGGPVFITGYWNGENNFNLYGNSDFTGTAIVSNRARVVAFHSNAFGTAANAVRLQSVGGYNGHSSLRPDSTLPNGLNGNKSFSLGPAGTVVQPRGTIWSNSITMDGGYLSFSSSGSGARTNAGAITANSGTVSTIDGGGRASGDWYQTGTLSGNGAILLSGYRTDDDVKLHFAGNGSGYSGSITNLRSGAYTWRYVGGDNALGTGIYYMLGQTTNETMLQLDRGVALANTFAGTGRVDCLTYTLTNNGTLAPGDAATIGKLFFASSGAGKLDFRGTVKVKYTLGTNDLIGTSALTFGAAGGQAAVNAVWLGGGSAPVPAVAGTNLVLFTYYGTDPVISTPWTVTAPRGIVGAVSVNTSAKKVILTLTPQLYWSALAASNLTTTGASVYGTLGVTNADVKLFWDTSDKGASPGAWTYTNVVGSSAAGTVGPVALTNLDTAQTYSFRFYGTNTTLGIEAWSTAGSFSTLAPVGAPTIVTDPATSITPTSANLNGTLTSTGGASSSITVYWGTRDQGRTTSGWLYTNAFGPYTAAVPPSAPFSTNVTWAATDLIYFYRYCADNGSLGWGDAQSFLAGTVWVNPSDVSAAVASPGTAVPVPGTVTVWRAATATNAATTVNFTLAGTAVNGVDYTTAPAGSNLTIAAGQDHATVVITPVFTVNPNSKTAVLTLDSGLYVTGTPNQATVTIQGFSSTPKDVIWDNNSGNGNWDRSSGNWHTNGAANGSATFLDGDNATFGLAGTPTVSLALNLPAGTVNVSGTGAWSWNGSSTLTVTNAFVYGSSGASTFNPVLAGSGSLAVTNGTLTLPVANTFGGGTTVRANVTVANNAALGTGAVSVQSNGVVYLTGATLANAITFEDGGTLRTKSGGEGLNGLITLNGTAYMWSGNDNQDLTLYLNQAGGRITGSGGLYLGMSYWNKDTTDRIAIYGNNDFTGPTTISTNVYVTAYHANALGVGTNTVMIFGKPTQAGSSTLLPDSTLTNGLNGAKSFWCGPKGWLMQPQGTTWSNAITLAGGGCTVSSSGSGPRTNMGSIVTVAGTTSTVTRYSGGSDWYQTGTLSGSGALTLIGYREWDTVLHFNGSNNGFSGDVILAKAGINDPGERNHVGVDTGLGMGKVILQGTATNMTMLTLDRSVTLPNAFEGLGRIDAASYTLTSTGSFSPGGTNIGTIMTSGTLDFRGAYNWGYTSLSNDLVAAATLVFGNPGGQAAVNVTWLGAGDPPVPPAGGTNYVLFTYTGTNVPAVTTPWTVTAPKKMNARVTVDDPNKRVLISLRPPSGGTLVIVR